MTSAALRAIAASTLSCSFEVASAAGSRGSATGIVIEVDMGRETGAGGRAKGWGDDSGGGAAAGAPTGGGAMFRGGGVTIGEPSRMPLVGGVGSLVSLLLSPPVEVATATTDGGGVNNTLSLNPGIAWGAVAAAGAACAAGAADVVTAVVGFALTSGTATPSGVGSGTRVRAGRADGPAAGDVVVLVVGDSSERGTAAWPLASPSAGAALFGAEASFACAGAFAPGLCTAGFADGRVAAADFAISFALVDADAIAPGSTAVVVLMP